MKIVVRKWDIKSITKLAIIGAVMLAYLVLAVRKWGVWAGALFAVIFVAGFIYQRSRRK
ncbi:MAG TPA: hypothetical protein VJ999_00430 [Candidatus Sulfotelmatobacter sp.]|nr:hypothetical protein [Candidatus Sulfotelmatobacter sp.]